MQGRYLPLGRGAVFAVQCLGFESHRANAGSRHPARLPGRTNHRSFAHQEVETHLLHHSTDLLRIAVFVVLLADLRKPEIVCWMVLSAAAAAAVDVAVVPAAEKSEVPVLVAGAEELVVE